MWYFGVLILILKCSTTVQSYDFKTSKDGFDRSGDGRMRGDKRYAPFTLKIDDDYDRLNIVGLEKGDRENIYRPCQLDDWTCIRKFLAANSRCIPQYGPLPDPLYLKQNTAYVPNINVTISMTKMTIQGLSNVKISEFYVNKDTRNLVIGIAFKDFNVSTIAYFGYQRTAKESIVLHDFATGFYRSGTFTAVIPKVPHLRLDKADIHIEFEDGYPPYYVGPRALVSTDLDVIAATANLAIAFPIIIREIYLFEAPLFTNIFIQTNLCDFGDINYSY